jgi:hypothetical protein
MKEKKIEKMKKLINYGICPPALKIRLDGWLNLEQKVLKLKDKLDNSPATKGEDDKWFIVG